MYASSEKKILGKNFVENIFNKNNLWSYMDRFDFKRQISFKWDNYFEKLFEIDTKKKGVYNLFLFYLFFYFLFFINWWCISPLISPSILSYTSV
jgi:hypothetical protein